MAVSNSPFTFVVIVGIVTNILSVVGVVICNKYIIEVDNFNFSVFLSFLHFAFTTMGMRMLLALNYFTYTEAPFSGVLPLAMGSLLSVAFMNLNLAYNSVGFYQLSKLACIPFTLFVQYTFYNQSVSRSVQLTLVPITFGVGYATVYDLSLSSIGFAFAVCAVVATAMAQIFTNTYQKSLDCNALQLLYHTAPYITLVSHKHTYANIHIHIYTHTRTHSKHTYTHIFIFIFTYMLTHAAYLFLLMLTHVLPLCRAC